MRQFFVNLPVKNIARTREFFSALGFSFEPKFSNDAGLCMQINDHCYAMLLQESFFQTFTKKPIADTSQVVEMLLCLSCESREEVDAMMTKALAAGGTAPGPAQDHGFMYDHGFEDLDGHSWGVMWMDTNAAAPQA